MSKLLTERELLSCPGDTIAETLEERNIRREKFAMEMKETFSRMNDLLSGKELLTEELALKLERVLGIDYLFWINREKNYREKLLKIEQQEAAKK